jgi:hypothetical protein
VIRRHITGQNGTNNSTSTPVFAAFGSSYRFGGPVVAKYRGRFLPKLESPARAELFVFGPP